MNSLYPSLIECDTQLFSTPTENPNYLILYFAMIVLAMYLGKNKKTI